MSLSTWCWLAGGVLVILAALVTVLTASTSWSVATPAEAHALTRGTILLAATAGGQTEGSRATTGQPSSGKQVRRFGAVIGLRPEKKDYYIELHKNTWPGVLEQIRRSNIRNYSIFLAELEGKLYLFAYYEYVGDDYEADMKKMAEDPETQRWWKETDPCQIRLPNTPEGHWWKPIPEVFHTD